MIKKIFAPIFFILVLVITPNVFAAEEFATSYDVVYDVSDDGVTTVTEKIILRNLTSQYFANQFKLTIGATQISGVKAEDEGGVMEVDTKQTGHSTSLTVKFNQQIAGLNKTLPWTLQFKSKDFAEKVGKVWEVRAPKISTTSNLQSYNLTIAVPQGFGEPTLISPTPKSQTVSSGKMFLTFEKNQLQDSGVSASFGSNQLFDFNLTYHLANSNLVPILTNIALPPDTSFQDVIFQRLEPNPINVTVDDDGNYLAWYRLNRGQKLDVLVVGSAKLYSRSKVKNPKLPEALRKKYTEGNKYWEKGSPEIQAKLKDILGADPPAQGPETVKLIYRSVVNSLKYDSSRLGEIDSANGGVDRLGAVTALNNPSSAVCMEFTDLFIALARAAGIPARELDGYAYTLNPTLRPLSLTKDILHAWPEYFDEKRGWVMVDPTWENTTGGVDYFSKLDLNHFVFAIKGSSSEQPAPAGSYKYSGQDSRDVKVSLSENDFLGKPQISVQIDVGSSIWAGFPNKAKIKISNAGNSFLPSTTLAVTGNKLLVQGMENQLLGPIPAFGNATFEFNLRTTRHPFGVKSLFDGYKDSLVVAVGGQRFTKNVEIKPFLLFQAVPLVIGGVVGLMFLVYLGVLGAHFYKK